MRTQRHLTSAVHESQQPEFLAKALTSVANAIFITDHRGRIVWVNDAFSRLSGYSPDEAVGNSPSFLKSGKQDTSFYHELWQTILAGNVWRGEVIERCKDGSLVTVDEVITPLRDDNGAITHYIAIQHDITRRKQEGDRDHFLAYHDPLTGLANRALFLDVLDQTLANARRTNRCLAVLYVDIDNFKSINDTLGHQIGDRLLIAVADRLVSTVRKTDTVARLSGDEFAIIQTELLSTDVATALAGKVLQNISQPFALEDHKIETSVSIGIAFYPTDGATLEDLLRNADRAMYRAKNQGRNRYRLFGHVASQAIDVKPESQSSPKVGER